MTKHKTGTREEWLAARLGLLKEEKELTRRSDEVAQRRQELPWVRVDKEYRFETDEGSASLADLFRGRHLPHLFHLCARTGRPLGHVPMARPRPQGPQRGVWRQLVAPPRRVRQALSQVMGGCRWRN